MKSMRLVNIAPYEEEGYFLVKCMGQKVSKSVPLFDVPTAEIPDESNEVKQTAGVSEWVKQDDGKYHCDFCGEKRIKAIQPYCHNCGCTMEGEKR